MAWARNANGDFQAARAQYSESVAILKSVKSDKELKENPAVMRKLDEINKFLGEYLAGHNRTESHDKILREMQKEITDFRQKITVNAPVTQPAEHTESNEGGAGSTGTVNKPTDLALGVAATGVVSSALGEVQAEIKDTAGKFMKNPLVSILGFTGFTKE